MLLHASCVAINGKGVLLAGKSGAGKSDLALRLIDAGAQLVSDDQTQLRRDKDQLMASPPAILAGMLEIRSLGLVKMTFLAAAPVALYVDLVDPGEKLERLPENAPVFFLDHPVQRLRLAPFDASTPAKIRAYLSYTLIT